MQIVRPGGQVIRVAEVVEEEGDKLHVRGIDIVPVAEQRLGHHTAEIEDRRVQPARLGCVWHRTHCARPYSAAGASSPSAGAGWRDTLRTARRISVGALSFTT